MCKLAALMVYLVESVAIKAATLYSCSCDKQKSRLSNDCGQLLFKPKIAHTYLYQIQIGKFDMCVGVNPQCTIMLSMQPSAHLQNFTYRTAYLLVLYTCCSMLI